jgi:hypothetical protein
MLDAELADALAVIPKDCQRRLDMTRFWVEPETSGVGYLGGQQYRAPAMYVPIAHKLVGTGYEKEGGIEIGADYYLHSKYKFASKIYPYLLLHEMTHAYQDRVLEFRNAEVEKTYKSAMQKKLYDDVEVQAIGTNGQVETRKMPAYARTNQFEYFAELSVAYLAKNWAYPYTAEDLRKHDPDGYKLMESVWGEKPKQK